MLKTLVCNWKMNGNLEYCAKIKSIFADENYKELYNVIICPPYTLLHQFEKSAFSLGSQDCSAENEHRYTGEIDVEMLKEMSVTHVIVGHSERRRCLEEKEERLIRKLSVVLEAGLIPIVCVRRVAEDREYIKDVYNAFMSFAMTKRTTDMLIYIAYEPESSIGSGIPDTLYSIGENCCRIREIFKNDGRVKVLYGGSVNSENIDDINQLCDGVLLGKASINYDEFSKILRANLNCESSQIEVLKTYLHQD